MPKKYDCYLQVVHHNRHVTNIPVILPYVKDPFERTGLREIFITDYMQNISPHLLPGSEVFLILKSKYHNGT